MVNGALSFILVFTLLAIPAHGQPVPEGPFVDEDEVSMGAIDSTPVADRDENPCVIPPEGFFAGSYLMEQISGSDPFFGSETFGDTQIVEIEPDGGARSFDFLYFPGIFNSDYSFTMFLCDGVITVTGRILAGGLGCGGANIGFSTGEPISTYDETFPAGSDDVIHVNVSDFDPDGNCETGSYPVELRFSRTP